jgi:hypothetical protein
MGAIFLSRLDPKANEIVRRRITLQQKDQAGPFLNVFLKKDPETAFFECSSG